MSTPIVTAPDDVAIKEGMVAKGESLWAIYRRRFSKHTLGKIGGIVLVVLYLLAVLALAAMGYHVGIAGTNRSPALLAVAIAFSAVILVIADLDRPGQGLINVSQEPMVELRATLAKSKP